MVKFITQYSYIFSLITGMLFAVGLGTIFLNVRQKSKDKVQAKYSSAPIVSSIFLIFLGVALFITIIILHFSWPFVFSTIVFIGVFFALMIWSRRKWL